MSPRNEYEPSGPDIVAIWKSWPGRTSTRRRKRNWPGSGERSPVSGSRSPLTFPKTSSAAAEEQNAAAKTMLAHASRTRRRIEEPPTRSAGFSPLTAKRQVRKSQWDAPSREDVEKSERGSGAVERTMPRMPSPRVPGPSATRRAALALAVAAALGSGASLGVADGAADPATDRKSTRLNSSHLG